MAISLTRGKALSGGFQITRGLARHAPAQTIDMGDAALSLSVGASSGKTQLTSDILYIDPNSVGGTENLLLPPEADCDGLLLFIAEHCRRRGRHCCKGRFGSNDGCNDFPESSRPRIL